MKRFLAVLMAVAMLLSLVACGGNSDEGTQPVDNGMETVDVTEAYSYAAHIELSDDMTEVPDGVTLSHDIVYYEEGRDFTYGEGTEADAHSADEAAEHLVVTITQPGAYLLTGKLNRGQVAVDLGKEAEDDPNAVVTLIFGGADITCTVAPAVIFYNVYECGDDDEPAKDVDTSKAGANVIIADDTVNTVNGSYVARIYKSVVLSDDGKEVIDSKKLHKYDAAFYSKMSMNVGGGEKGNGSMLIGAENEGLDSELHLTINGGCIEIDSGNDGINTNEDGVSVTTINDGKLTIRVNGSTGEGDGIDSNGWLVINGGTVNVQGCATSMDAGIDSDMGIYINGGTVMAAGNMLDRIAGGNATYVTFVVNSQKIGGKTLSLKNAEDAVVLEWKADNNYSYVVVSAPELVAGDYTLWMDGTQLQHNGSMGGDRFGGFGGFGGGMGNMQLPEGMEGFEMPEGMENFDPNNMQRPEGNFGGGRDFGGGMANMQLPEGMEGFELPEGMENGRPNGFGGMGGMQRPEGMEDFELPEGMDGFDPGMMQHPDGNGGQQSGEPSDVFTIVAGGNQFAI